MSWTRCHRRCGAGLLLCWLALGASAAGCRCQREHAPGPTGAASSLEAGPGLPLHGCAFAPGDLPRKTLGRGAPVGSDLPLDHFIFVVQENRSFDQYFQAFTPAPGTTIDVAPPGWTVLGPHGRPMAPFAMEHPCQADPPHDWASVLRSWSGGKMDGFALVGGREAVGFYHPHVLEYYHALARAFALSDRHFADFLGPTWPNRLFMLSATSFGHADNAPPPRRDFELSLFHQLDAAGISWRVYADGEVFETTMYPALHQRRRDHFRSIAQYVDDAQRGALPALAWVESTYTGHDATDEHPPANIELGQKWVRGIVEAAMRGPEWGRTLLILTYDEHGGFFDHVPPPAACVPDPHEPKTSPRRLAPRFDHYGMRVPLILVSPWSKRGYVSHVPTSHSSLLRLVQARFELPALTRRDANATPPFDLLDLSSRPRLEVPALPEARVEPSRRDACRQIAGIPSTLPH